MVQQKFDESTRSEVIKLWESGSNVTAITSITGISKSSIGRILQADCGQSTGGSRAREVDKELVIQLRLKDRMSLDEILEAINHKYAKSTVYLWTKPFPLTAEELKIRISNKRAPLSKSKNREEKAHESVIHKLTSGQKLSRNQKGLISECAVTMRLVALGFNVSKPVSPHSIFDLAVIQPGSNEYLTVQVKSARYGKHGLPTVSLKRTGPRQNGKCTLVRYEKGDFDILVGYDIKTDTAYVFTEAETLNHASGITCKAESVERWDKLKSVERQGVEP